jgi:hypothetical protein
MFKAAVFGTVVVSLLSPWTAPSAATSPPSDDITIAVVAINGSGCPAGTATVAVASDNTAFTVTYQDFLARIGPGAAPTDLRKNCQLSIRVNVPQGFTYAVAQARYEGNANLAAGSTGLERASVYFQGRSHTTFFDHTLEGPFNGDWQTVDTANVATLVYAPCGAQVNLNVNTELRVNAGTSNPATTPSYLEMNSSRDSVQTVYQLSWAHCG